MSENLKSAIELTCTDIQPGQVKVEYKVSRNAVDSEANVVAKDFTQHAQVPGFRVGKAPLGMVKSKFAPHIKEELTKRIMNVALDKFNDERKVEVVAFNLPEGAKPPVLEFGQDFAFAMEFDLAPEFTLPEYKGMKVETKEVEVSDKEIEERIESHKKMYATYQDIEEPAQKEDMLKVSYTSDFKLAEDAPVSLKRQVACDDNWLWLNDPEVIPGAIKALTGAEKGKEYKFTAEYPENHRETALAGKKVAYTVTVNTIQRRVPVADLKELCTKMNVESEDQLKEQIRESIKNEAKIQVEREKREKIVAELESAVGEMTFPPTALAQETQKELRHIASSAVKSEADAEQFKKDVEKHKKEAEKNAKAKLHKLFIMKRIADKENISVSESEIEQQIKGMSGYYGLKAADLRKIMEENGGLDDLHMDMLVAKVTDFLIENSVA